MRSGDSSSPSAAREVFGIGSIDRQGGNSPWDLAGQLLAPALCLSWVPALSPPLWQRPCSLAPGLRREGTGGECEGRDEGGGRKGPDGGDRLECKARRPR